MTARKKKQEPEAENNITSLPKRKPKKQSFLDLAAETVSSDGPLIPLDPTERYAWDKVWDWFIKTTRPYVLAYAQEEETTKAA